MAVDKLLVILCTFSFLRCGLCQLNLSEGSPCPAHNASNGKCVRLFRCGSAVLTYLYRNAGFGESKDFPLLPEICSYKNDEPIVCCTDCAYSNHDEFKESAIAPHGILVSRRGPVAWKKCLDYFQRLPYSCRGKGEVQLKKNWIETKQCHNATLHVKLSVGGHESQAWKFPHLALLGYGDTAASAQWLCEGTVISERFILTSAHCTNAGVLGTVAYASLGESQVDPEKQWQIYEIKKIIIHPDYNEPSWYHDLALLETETEIRFDSEILPACLYVGIHDASVAVTAGNNSQEKTASQPNQLQTVYQESLDQMECATVYQPDNNLIHGYDHRTQICYGLQNELDNTCKRLSGSPLQIDQFRCQYTVVGVTARAQDCGKSELPDVYTRIQHYVPWIEGIVWPQED